MTAITETPSDALTFGTAELFDTETYPIDSQGGDGYEALLEKGARRPERGQLRAASRVCPARYRRPNAGRG